MNNAIFHANKTEENDKKLRVFASPARTNISLIDLKQNKS